MATIFTPEFLKPYFNNQKKHAAYEITCKIAEDLRIHSEGENPGKLIEERRPSESETIKKYRNQIYVAITKSIITKIVTALSKIRKSSDWSIKYDKSKIPASIIEDETLESYCEKNYPTFGSVTKWVFDVLLKSYLVDPNSIILELRGDQMDVKENEYHKPYSIIFPSDRVYDFVDEKYAILYSTEKSEYTLDSGMKMYDGNVFYTCDTKVIQRWVQKDALGGMQIDYEYYHKLDRMPAFKVGGVLFKTMDNITVYESRIAGTVPHLKEAVREYSDLQAEVVQHVHSEKWSYRTQKCVKCKSTGRDIVEGKTVVCDACKGEGTIPTSPYSSVEMDLPKMGEQAIQGPPFGYVQKNVEIIKIQDERVDKHCYRALASINMEFLAQTPLSQSGDAKNVDREELNTFVDSIAEDLVSIMDKKYKLDCDYRYSFIITNPKKRAELLPTIAVPQNYDILSSNYLLQELQGAKTAKLNTVTVTALEVEYANKKFNNSPAVRDEVKAVLTLDPFPDSTEDEKLVMLQNSGVTEEDYIISCNINSFVKRAIEEDKGFLKLNLVDQKKVVLKYAEEIKKSLSAKEAVLPTPELDPNKNPAATK